MDIHTEIMSIVHASIHALPCQKMRNEAIGTLHRLTSFGRVGVAGISSNEDALVHGKLRSYALTD